MHQHLAPRVGERCKSEPGPSRKFSRLHFSSAMVWNAVDGHDWPLTFKRTHAFGALTRRYREKTAKYRLPPACRHFQRVRRGRGLPPASHASQRRWRGARPNRPREGGEFCEIPCKGAVGLAARMFGAIHVEGQAQHDEADVFARGPRWQVGQGLLYIMLLIDAY
jgi:hypothetical protein